MRYESCIYLNDSSINKGNEDLFQRDRGRGGGGGEREPGKKSAWYWSYLKPWVSAGRFLLKGFEDGKKKLHYFSLKVERAIRGKQFLFGEIHFIQDSGKEESGVSQSHIVYVLEIEGTAVPEDLPTRHVPTTQACLLF